MKSPYSFIVKPYNNRRYDNVKSYGDIEFITSTSEEDHKSSNRFAIVISTPINYTGPIKEGDILLVHHNVFKFYNDMYGRRKSGKSFFKDDLFFVDVDQFYLYKSKGESNWKGYSKYCFIKPLKAQKSYLNKNSKNEPLQGTVKYINDELTKKGVKVGDKVLYEPESEYEFIVDDEKLYRMFTKNITVVL
jgi:hypothetical protein